MLLLLLWGGGGGGGGACVRACVLFLLTDIKMEKNEIKIFGSKLI